MPMISTFKALVCLVETGLRIHPLGMDHQIFQFWWVLKYHEIAIGIESCRLVLCPIPT